ncbi:hypothetical protein GOBAR_DD11254 [Gossypium barbadense]|nr:hypothetical protein GOBAR_DD11254 [Gossypium barbadense]
MLIIGESVKVTRKLIVLVLQARLVSAGKLCIEFTLASKIAFISEELCIGCGICVKKCPFEAIKIINLPRDLDKDTTHRYKNITFKLHRLPVPRPGQVLGLVGTNGIGKSTTLKVFAGKLKPNLGHFNNPPYWQEIVRSSKIEKILRDNRKNREGENRRRRSLFSFNNFHNRLPHTFQLKRKGK